MDSFTAFLFLICTLGVVTIATLGYLCSRSLEAPFVLFAALMAVAAGVGFSPLLFLATDPDLRAAFKERARASAEAQERAGKGSLVQAASALAPDATPGEVVMAWTRLYGQDTAKAALLTTERFRGGEPPQPWAKRVQQALEEISYRHLGGMIESETVRGDSAVVVLKASIVAVDGISTQREIYTLNRVGGRWLIDELRVEDEVVPGGKLRFSF
jgi:hypothetical protein